MSSRRTHPHPSAAPPRPSVAPPTTDPSPRQPAPLITLHPPPHDPARAHVAKTLACTPAADRDALVAFAAHLVHNHQPPPPELWKDDAPPLHVAARGKGLDAYHLPEVHPQHEEQYSLPSMTTLVGGLPDADKQPPAVYAPFLELPAGRQARVYHYARAIHDEHTGVKSYDRVSVVDELSIQAKATMADETKAVLPSKCGERK